MTVHEVSKQTGVSVRTLHYYDEIGLLPPAKYTEAGYRIYDEESLKRIQQILFFRELEFPLREIKEMLDSTSFDSQKVLQDQIALLTLKKEHIDSLLSYAKKLEKTGGMNMSFDVFDQTKIEAYKKEAKKQWGNTPAYQEYEEKTKGYSKETEQNVAKGLMDLFVQFGKYKKINPAEKEVQQLVETLQTYISEHYYTCTKEILAGLGQMYTAGGEMTDNIDAAGGPGTAQFAANAIAVFVNKE